MSKGEGMKGKIKMDDGEERRKGKDGDKGGQ